MFSLLKALMNILTQITYWENTTHTDYYLFFNSLSWKGNSSKATETIIKLVALCNNNGTRCVMITWLQIDCKFWIASQHNNLHFPKRQATAEMDQYSLLSPPLYTTGFTHPASCVYVLLMLTPGSLIVISLIVQNN